MSDNLTCTICGKPITNLDSATSFSVSADVAHIACICVKYDEALARISELEAENEDLKQQVLEMEAEVSSLKQDIICKDQRNAKVRETIQFLNGQLGIVGGG